jgi:FemAB-related protein (PEP-CTERM system-associated)
MTRVRPAVEEDRERWDAYVSGHPDSQFAQRWAWRMLTLESYGVEDAYAIAEDGGSVRGVLPLFHDRRGRRLFSPPGGLLADDADTAAALLEPACERVRRESLQWLELRDQKRAWPGLETSAEHVTLVLDLARSPEEQWRAFDSKLRNQIRKGEKGGFRARWGHAQVAPFHRVMVETMRDLGTPIRGVAYFRRALERLGSSADVLVLEGAGGPAAAMFTVTHRDTMSDPWASSLRRHFAGCANQVLYWEALRRAIALGLSRFDFGRSQWHSGTFRFKRQWGGRPVPLHYQYVLGTATRVVTLGEQRSRLGLASRVWRRLPVPVARVLGEPAKRRFPEVV